MVKCEVCGWQGYECDLVVKSYPLGMYGDSTVYEDYYCCPLCKSNEVDEIEEECIDYDEY